MVISTGYLDVVMLIASASGGDRLIYARGAGDAAGVMVDRVARVGDGIVA